MKTGPAKTSMINRKSRDTHRQKPFFRLYRLEVCTSRIQGILGNRDLSKTLARQAFSMKVHVFCQRKQGAPQVGLRLGTCRTLREGRIQTFLPLARALRHAGPGAMRVGRQECLGRPRGPQKAGATGRKSVSLRTRKTVATQCNCASHYITL